ncbi:MAG TPA: hypothetical protein VIL36_01650 [Acidimicrobiales bacterium]
MSRTRYTFGDGDVAADRLALVASVFEPSSRRLLARAPRSAARTSPTPSTPRSRPACSA